MNNRLEYEKEEIKTEPVKPKPQQENTAEKEIKTVNKADSSSSYLFFAVLIFLIAFVIKKTVFN